MIEQLLSNLLYAGYCWLGCSIVLGIFDETTKNYSGQMVFVGTMMAGIGFGYLIQ